MSSDETQTRFDPADDEMPHQAGRRRNGKRATSGPPLELLMNAEQGDGGTAPASVLSAVRADLPSTDTNPEFEETLITQNLEAVLTALVALRSESRHGSGLIDDISMLFDTEPSPGSVYPRLHDLEGAGVLERFDLVQTKQYAIDDEDAARRCLEAAMYQHLAIGGFLAAALEEL